MGARVKRAVELMEQEMQAREERERAFIELAKRFREASDPRDVQQLGDQLGRFIFGDKSKIGNSPSTAEGSLPR